MNLASGLSGYHLVLGLQSVRLENLGRMLSNVDRVVSVSNITVVQGDRVNGRELLAAQLMQLAFLKIGVTLRPVMLISGNSEEVVDKWIREQEAEVKAMHAKLYFKVSGNSRKGFLIPKSWLTSSCLTIVDFQLGCEEERLSDSDTP